MSETTLIECPNVVLRFYANRFTRFRVMNSNSGLYFFWATLYVTYAPKV